MGAEMGVVLVVWLAIGLGAALWAKYLFDNSQAMHVWGPFAAFFFPLYLPCWWVWRRSKAKRFNDVFGVPPWWSENAVGDIIMGRVRTRLGHRAAHLQANIQKEMELFMLSRQAGILDTRPSILDELAEARARVVDAKRVFWAAHKLGTIFDYSLASSWKEFVPRDYRAEDVLTQDD